MVKLVFVVCFSFFIQAICLAQKILTIDDMLNRNELFNGYGYLPTVSLSGDAKMLAYVVMAGNRAKQRKALESSNSVTIASLFNTADIWITKLDEKLNWSNPEVRKKQAICLTGQVGSNFCPVWSPDSKNLAFLSNRDGQMKIWFWNRHSGLLKSVETGFTEKVTINKPVSWLPDGKQLIVNYTKLRAEQRINNKVTGATILVYKSPNAINNAADINYADFSSYKGDLILIDVEKNKSLPIVKNDSISWFATSPNGKYLAYMRPVKMASSTWAHTQQEIRVISLDKSSNNYLKTIAFATCRQGIAGGRISWSPNSDRLVYFDYEANSEGVVWNMLVKENTQPLKLVSSTMHFFKSHLSSGTGWEKPIWSKDGRFIYLTDNKPNEANGIWEIEIATAAYRQIGIINKKTITSILAADERREILWQGDSFHNKTNQIYVTTRDTETFASGLGIINLNNGEIKILQESQKNYLKSPNRFMSVLYAGATAKDCFVFASEDAQNPFDIWMWNASESAKAHLVTILNPHLTNYSFGATKLINWKTETGETLRGTLTLPANYDESKSYPLIVYQYPYSTYSNLINAFGGVGADIFHTQLYATRGYMVFTPDLPLKPSEEKNIMQVLQTKLRPGIDTLIALGYADRKRIGIIGHSYGGYSTMSFLVQDSIYAAGVSVSPGMVDRFLQYGNLLVDGTSYYATENDRKMGGNPWQVRDVYINNSPFYFLNKVETPLLLIHGSNDNATPYISSQQIFIGLRQMRKTVKLVIYKNEPHVPGDWTYEHQVHYHQEILNWFEKYLKQK